MKKRILEIVCVFLILTILILIAFYPHFFDNIPYIGGYDSRGIYRLFYQEFKQLISNSIFQGTFPFWSWNTFLGNNFWASKTYYLVGDIYNYLLIFTDLHYYTVLLFITILKIYVSALSFYVYGKFRGWDAKWVILGSLLFSFSAWSMEYIEQPMFLSFYSLLPLYFYGVEKILKNSRYAVFTLSVFLLVSINYYLFLTLTICSVVYYLYRYYEINGDLKKSIVSILKIIPFYLLGLGLAAPIIIPSGLYILLNDRVANTSFNFWFFEDYRVYIHMFTTLFVPSSTFITKSIVLNGETIFTSLFEPSPYQLREIMAWAGSLTAVMVLYSLFDKNKVQRRLNRFYFAFLAIIMILPVGNAIMHGAIEPSFRWLMFPVFMNIVIALNYLNRLDDLDFERISRIVYIIGIALIALLIPMIMNAQHALVVYRGQILIFIAFTSLFVLTYLFLRKKNIRAIFAIAIIELSFVGFLSVYNYQSENMFTWEYVESYEKVLGKNNQLNNFIKENFDEDEYYRVYAPEDAIYWYMSLNSNLLYNFSDVKTYDSAFQPALTRLSQWLPESRPLPQTWNIKNPDLIDFLSVKYAVVTDENQLPHTNFEYLGEYNWLRLYKNLNYRPILQNVSSLIKWEDALTMDISSINKFGIVDNEVFDEIEAKMQSEANIKAENVDIYQNMMIATIDADDSTFIVSSIAYDDGWKAFVNDVETEVYTANGGFLSFIVPQGINNVKLYFQPVGFKTGAYVSVLSLITYIGYIAFGLMRKKSKTNL